MAYSTFWVSIHDEEKEGGALVQGKTTNRTRLPEIVANLTQTEQDLLSHMKSEYQLETNSLGGNPVLRRLKDDEGMRPTSANRNTVKALEERGLIVHGKSRDPLKIVWRLKK